MPLPEYTESGDLPIGVHEVHLSDVVSSFGQSTNRRKQLALRLIRVYEIAAQTGHLGRFVVFGSFITTKTEPNDIDIFMIMDDNFDFGQLTGDARILFDHAPAQDHFGCSIFWVRRLAAMGGEQAAIEDWQIKRDGSKRGIIEIVGE